MYEHHSIPLLKASAEIATAAPIVRYGVQVYIDSDPDGSAEDIYIDPNDEAGIAIFRKFASKMAEHYKKLSS